MLGVRALVREEQRTRGTKRKHRPEMGRSRRRKQTTMAVTAATHATPTVTNTTSITRKVLPELGPEEHRPQDGQAPPDRSLPGQPPRARPLELLCLGHTQGQHILSPTPGLCTDLRCAEQRGGLLRDMGGGLKPPYQEAPPCTTTALSCPAQATLWRANGQHRRDN